MDWEPSKFRKQRNGMEEYLCFKQIHNKNKEIEMRRKYFTWIKNNIWEKSMITWLKTNKKRNRKNPFTFQGLKRSFCPRVISFLNCRKCHLSTRFIVSTKRSFLIQSCKENPFQPCRLFILWTHFLKKSNKLWNYKNISLAYRNIYLL